MTFTLSTFLLNHLKRPVPQSTWHPVCWTFSRWLLQCHVHQTPQQYTVPLMLEKMERTFFVVGALWKLSSWQKWQNSYKITTTHILILCQLNFFMSNLTGSNSSCRNWGNLKTCHKQKIEQYVMWQNNLLKLKKMNQACSVAVLTTHSKTKMYLFNNIIIRVKRAETE